MAANHPPGSPLADGSSTAQPTDRLRHLAAAPRRSGYTPTHTKLVRWLRVALPVAGLLTIAIVAYVRGQSPLGALAIGAALGALLVLLPLMFDPIPTPLSREQWPIRLPVLRRLARIRHWANPFYVEQITLHSVLAK